MSRRRVGLGLLAATACVVLALVVRDRPATLAPVAQRRPATPEATGGSDAIRWQRLIAQDERGVVPDDALLRALEARAVLAERRLNRPAVAGVGRGNWEWVGPTNYAGRMRTIVVHPTRTNHVLGGSAGGGIWKSENAGQSWRPTDDYLGSMNIQSLALHPIDPERIYAGTGEFSSGVGVVRSTDFGETWQQVPGTEAMGGGGIRRLAFSSTGVLYAATSTGVYRVPDSGLLARLAPAFSWDVQVSPTNPSHLLAVQSPFGSQASTVISRTLDAGATWTTSGGFSATTPYATLAFARSNPQIVYALSGDDGGKLYRSHDGGATFALAFQGAPAASPWPTALTHNQPFRNLALWVNPFDPASVIAGGVVLWKSTTSGASWELQTCPGTAPTPPSQHYCSESTFVSGGPVDFAQVVSHPLFDNVTNRSVYVTFDQGAYRLADIGQASVTFLNQSLGTMQFYNATGDGATGRILTGSQDTGVHVMGPTLPGLGTLLTPGDGGPGAFDPTNPNRAFVSTQWLDLFLAIGIATPPLGFSRLTQCHKAPPFQLPDSCARTTNFIAPFVMDPHAPARLYAGGLRLWRTTNGGDFVGPSTGPIWSDLNVPDATAANFISAIAVSPLNPDSVWVARNSGAVFRTSNATTAQPSWTRVGAGELPGRYVTNLTIWPHDDAVVYATFGGSSPGNKNIWRTLDGGASWHSTAGSGPGSLPAVPVREVLAHPSSQGGHWLYAATDVGLFTSEDGGNSWAATSDSPTNASIYDMFWMGQTLHLATHGRSIWRAAVPSPSPAPCAFVLTPENTSAAASGFQGQVRVTQLFAAAGPCAWTATSSASWASVSPPSGTGSGVAQLTVATNPGAARAAEIAIGSRRATITQSAGNPLAPGTPLQLQAQVSGTSIALSWIAGGGAAASNHLLEAGTSTGLTNVGAFHTGSGAPTFGASNVPPGTYFVRVRAVNASATSGPSNEVQFTVAGCLPAVPSGFQAAVTGTRVDFSWQAVPGMSYRLQAGRAPGLADVGTLPLGSGSTASATAPPGVYYVRLFAQNGCGSSPPSPEVVVTIAAPQAPGPPGGIAYAVAPGRVVSLTWAPPIAGGAPTGYVLEAGSVAGASDLAQVPIGPQTSFTAAGVPPRVYHVRVRAVNGAGIGPASPETVVTVR